MYKITYHFGYDELQAMPAEEASRLANERLEERRNSICDDFRAAIADSGMKLVTIADRTNQTSSNIIKSTTKPFSMSAERLNLFCDLLFPNKTLDEIFFGENLPMPLPHIDRCFLKAYSYFSLEGTTIRNKHENDIKAYIKAKTPEQATVYSRYFGVREDRWTDDPIREEYRNFPPLQNLTSYSMWRSGTATLHMMTLLKCAYYCDMSLDFLCRNDYSVCNLYYIENGKKIFVTDEEKSLLKDFCVLSYNDKVEILGEILKRIDFARYNIELNL